MTNQETQQSSGGGVITTDICCEIVSQDSESQTIDAIVVDCSDYPGLKIDGRFEPEMELKLSLKQIPDLGDKLAIGDKIVFSFVGKYDSSISKDTPIVVDRVMSLDSYIDKDSD